GRTEDMAAALATAGREAAGLFGEPALAAPGADTAPGGPAEVPADALTERFQHLVRDAGLPPSLVPALPARPHGRVTGDASPGLGEVLAELRTVRAQYRQGAFL
ncbi:hypothetical protein ABT381_01765, partial [Streptomyces sp. NPDC000151]